MSLLPSIRLLISPSIGSQNVNWPFMELLQSSLPSGLYAMQMISWSCVRVSTHPRPLHDMNDKLSSMGGTTTLVFLE